MLCEGMTQHSTESPSARIADRPTEGKQKAERIIPPGYFYVWMYRKQLGRRNLTDEQKTYMMGKMYEARKNSRGGQIGNTNAKNEVDKMSESFKSLRERKDGTSGQIGKEFGVDGKTIRRAEHFANGIDALSRVSPEAADKVLKGESRVTKSDVSEMREASKEEVEEFADAVKAAGVSHDTFT